MLNCLGFVWDGRFRGLMHHLLVAISMLSSVEKGRAIARARRDSLVCLSFRPFVVVMGVGCLNNTCSKRTLRDGGFLDAVDGPRDWTTSRYHEETGRDRSDVQLDTRYAVRQGLSTSGRLADSRATHVQAIPPTRGDPVPQLSHMHMHTPCTPCTLLQVGTPPPTKAWSPAAGWCSKPKAHPQPRATTRLSPPTAWRESGSAVAVLHV